MAYIIDGNNVMGQTPGWHRDKSGSRVMLVKRIATFVRRRKARVAVVFDGAPDRELPEGSAYRGVKVFYANRGSTADERIIGMVESNSDPRGLTIVTSDRGLAVAVRSFGVRIVRSGEFRKLLESAELSAPDSEDVDDSGAGDTAYWLRYFGAHPDDEDEPADRSGGGDSNDQQRLISKSGSISRRHRR